MADFTGLNYYDILGIEKVAPLSKVREAFRKLALICHPDMNNNSIESEAQFKIVNNAYSVLSDQSRRKKYDVYLNNSAVFRIKFRAYSGKKRTAYRPRLGDSRAVLGSVLSHLNYILWEIEDIISYETDRRRNQNEDSASEVILRILNLFDEKVLSVAGMPDYFYQARKISAPSKYEVLDNHHPAGHRPYANIKDYFYNVRNRANKFIEKASLLELTTPFSGSADCIIDNIMEIYNIATEELSYLNRME